jgi:hypothetical protein
MKTVRLCTTFALFAALFVIPRVASAQAGGTSDTLSETILDLTPGAAGPITITPPFASFTFPEATESFDTVVSLPGREINFLEAETQSRSDRFSIAPYQVRVASDANPNGLARRDNATLIPASALESFLPLSIVARSDGESTNQTQGSDSLTILIGYFGPGTGSVVFSGLIPQPPEGVAETPLVFVIPPTSFDIEEPTAETGGVQGKISDYLDIITQIEVRFISSDDQSVYGPAFGAVQENIQTGGGLNYALEFRSDAVPEPASYILLSIVLSSLALIGGRQSLRVAG